MVNNSTNINKANNHLSTYLTEHKKRLHHMTMARDMYKNVVV